MGLKTAVKKFTDAEFYKAVAYRELRWTWTRIARHMKVQERRLRYNMARGPVSLRSRRARAVSPRVTERRRVVKQLLRKKRTMKEKLPPSKRKNARKARVRTTFPFGSLARARRQLAVEHDIRVSKSTIQRDAAAARLFARRRPRGPGRIDGDETARLEFAKASTKFALEHAREMVHCDEKWFDDLNASAAAFQYVTNGEPAIPREKERFPPKVHVWVAVGIGFKRIVLFDKGVNVTSDVYRERCIRPVLATLQQRRLLQDNCGAHKGVKKWLGRNKVRTVNIPPRSPDMNITERVFAILAAKVSSEGPLNEDSLRQFVVRQFEALSQDVIDRLVLSWPSAVENVVTMKGSTSCLPLKLK